MENQTLSGLLGLDGLQNISAEVGYQHHEGTGTLDKIQNLIL